LRQGVGPYALNTWMSAAARGRERPENGMHPAAQAVGTQIGALRAWSSQFNGSTMSPRHPASDAGRALNDLLNEDCKISRHLDADNLRGKCICMYGLDAMNNIHRFHAQLAKVSLLSRHLSEPARVVWGPQAACSQALSPGEMMLCLQQNPVEIRHHPQTGAGATCSSCGGGRLPCPDLARN